MRTIKALSCAALSALAPAPIARSRLWSALYLPQVAWLRRWPSVSISA